MKTAKIRLRKPAFISAFRYRLPLPVKEVMEFASGDIYPICPRCECTMDREYMRFCDRCGQMLNWEALDDAHIVHPPLQKNRTKRR